MNRFALLLLLAFVVPASCLAAEPVSFYGSIWDNGGVSLRFDDIIPPGQKRTMELPAGQIVEMSVDAAGVPTVRMVDRSGKELHSSVSTPDGPNPLHFMYALCRRGVVAYSSPPVPHKSGCP
ncbi:hypothetical protein [Cognatilysobacter lacus]|uniref:Uncharacterized protein n=1 Tax=Cognatilysobacter lacus TaxID=1643323 RepID=A0A5D8ZDI6_9GAMM|nr:hypothetical protein [Lysobacter lacus]TZF90714.1 hypothetical protein FW784_04225 [Lysobacter lacus]